VWFVGAQKEYCVLAGDVFPAVKTEVRLTVRPPTEIGVGQAEWYLFDPAYIDSVNDFLGQVVGVSASAEHQDFFGVCHFCLPVHVKD